MPRGLGQPVNTAQFRAHLPAADPEIPLVATAPGRADGGIGSEIIQGASFGRRPSRRAAPVKEERNLFRPPQHIASHARVVAPNCAPAPPKAARISGWRQIVPGRASTCGAPDRSRRIAPPLRAMLTSAGTRQSSPE
ncbi:hypothetical protein Ga0080559_TMP1046 [Salipiger profundus]|uniref:Uncharacterized protein n=1 Tax=Salipiger profundus TaxID=1229727 RepID=A0A1U7D133_9RHOB|nr:hypothetical protein Ga0080559_TMP1046 [Salipiger profundus]